MRERDLTLAPQWDRLKCHTLIRNQTMNHQNVQIGTHTQALVYKSTMAAFTDLIMKNVTQFYLIPP